MHEREARFGECFAKARFELRRQADLRHEDERLAAALEHASDEVQVDLGFSTSRDPVQQQRGEAAQLLGDRLDHARLVRSEPMCRHETRRGCEWRAIERFARQRLEGTQSRRQRGDHRLAKRTLVIRGEEAHQLEPLGRQARRVAAHIDDRFQAIERELACAFGVDHHAGVIASAELHGHTVARGDACAFRQRVIEQPWQRHVERYPHAGISPLGQGLRICG